MDIFNAETSVQDKIQDAGKNTDTHHSAATAEPTPKGTAILLMMIHLSLSTLLMTTPQPLLPLTLELPSQKPRTALCLSIFLPRGSQYSWCFVFIFFLFLPSSCSVHRRMVHTLQRKGDESLLVFKCMAFRSFTGPVLIAGPCSSQRVPDTPSIVPSPLVFPPCVVVRVAIHSNCFRGLPPFFGGR